MSILHKLESVNFIKNFDEQRDVPEEHITQLLKVSNASNIFNESFFNITVVHNRKLQLSLNKFEDEEIELEKASHLFVFSSDNNSCENNEDIKQIYMALNSVILAAQDFNIDIYLLHNMVRENFSHELTLNNSESKIVLVLALGYRKNNKQIINKIHHELNDIVQLKY